MVSRTSDWRDELGRWLKPFLDRLGHKARRQMGPLYVSELIGPGDRKSVQPMAKRLALGACDQLHHFIAAGVWDATPVETELLVQADRLVGGSDAVLVIELGRWLKPFVDRLGHKARRRMCPLYVSGLIGPGDRKSIQPMASAS